MSRSRYIYRDAIKSPRFGDLFLYNGIPDQEPIMYLCPATDGSKDWVGLVLIENAWQRIGKMVPLTQADSDGPLWTHAGVAAAKAVRP